MGHDPVGTTEIYYRMKATFRIDTKFTTCYSFRHRQKYNINKGECLENTEEKRNVFTVKLWNYKITKNLSL
jgi:nitrite reductase/ring-hydroxylating ferredoxin subunit